MEPDILMPVIPACERLRQDNREFVPVDLIPSKYHKKKEGEGTEDTAPSRKAEEPFRNDDGEGSPTHCPLDSYPVQLLVRSPQAGLKADAWKPARHFLRALQLQPGSVQYLVTLSSSFIYV